MAGAGTAPVSVESPPSSTGGAPVAARGTRRLLALVGLVALLARGAHLASVVDTPAFGFHREFRDSDMYAFDQWARRIAAGDVLGRDPYQPVVRWQLAVAPAEQWHAWYGNPHLFFKAPLYPYLVAALYRLFGDAMLPLAILQVLASTVAALLLFRITARVFDARAAVCAALLFALYAPAMHYDVVMLRGPWIVLVSLAVTWQLLDLWWRPRAPASWRLGITAGVALLLNEGFVVLVPVLLVVLAWRAGAPRRAALMGGVFVAGVGTVLLPLVVRNCLVGAPPLGLAVTGATAYVLYNTGHASPFFYDVNAAEFRAVMAESGGRLLPAIVASLRSFDGVAAALAFYLAKAAAIVVPWENPDNANFYYAALRDPLLRFLPGWALVLPLTVIGLVLARRKAGRLLPLLPVALCHLLVLLLVFPFSRFRVVLAVSLLPLAGVALARGMEWFRSGRFAPFAAALATGLCLFAGATVLEHRLLAGDPRFTRYRGTEFTLAADVLTRAGRHRDATRELLDLARLNPPGPLRSVALLQAAESQVREGDRATAERTLALAVDGERTNPDFLLAVGDVHRQMLRDDEGALASYRAALALDPERPLRDALQSRIGAIENPRRLE